MVDKTLIVYTKDGKSLSAEYSEDVAKVIKEVHNIDMHQEVKDILVSELEKELRARAQFDT